MADLERQCNITGCERPRAAWGWCGTHYKRWQRHGSPTPGNTRHSSIDKIIERLDAWSMPEPTTGCVLWVGSENGVGYGVMQVNGHQTSAHRVAYEAAKGPIPDGMQIDHLCRVKTCINPDHLEAVTPAENIRRAVATRPERTHCREGHVLTDDNVIIEKSGAVRCRTCRQAYLENWRAQNA